MELIDRAAALNAGLKKYFTGKVCRNGHIAERYTQSSTCVECLQASQAAMRSSYDAQRTPERAAGNEYLSSLVSVRKRFAVASLGGISAIMEAAATIRFPLLAAKGARLFKEPRMTDRVAGTAIGQFLAHADDAAMLATLCDHSIDELTAKNVVAPPVLSPTEVARLHEENLRASERGDSPMNREFIP